MTNRLVDCEFIPWNPKGLGATKSFRFWGLDKMEPVLSIYLLHLETQQKYRIQFSRTHAMFVTDDLSAADELEQLRSSTIDARQSNFYVVENSELKERMTRSESGRRDYSSDKVYLIFAEDCWIEVLTSDEPKAEIVTSR